MSEENAFTSNSRSGIVTKVVVDLAYFKTLLQAEKQVLKHFEEKKERLKDDIFASQKVKGKLITLKCFS